MESQEPREPGGSVEPSGGTTSTPSTPPTTPTTPVPEPEPEDEPPDPSLFPDEDENESASQPESRQSVYKCSRCGATFTDEWDIAEHLQWHKYGEK